MWFLSAFSLLLLAVGVSVSAAPLVPEFPRLFTVTTTRETASRYASTWDIQRTGSQRLEGEGVQLRVLIHNDAQLKHLHHLQSSGHVHSKAEEEERYLQGIDDDLSCYRTVDETYASMQNLALQYPHLVTVTTIGESWLKQQQEGSEGHDILVLVLTSSATDDLLEKDNMMVVGGHHSRELPPPETILRWAEHLLASYGNDADITWILDRSKIHLVPIANPDGRQIVQDNLDWMYRKNAHPYGCGDKEDEGVDLNRNYPMWYGDSPGSSGNPCSSQFRGGGPLSEPETEAVYNYAMSLFSDDMKKGTTREAEARAEEACPTDASGIFMDVHSNGDFVYFPWGYEDKTSPNHHAFLTMGAKLAYPGSYELWAPEQEGFLYFVSGDVTDATYGMGCVASYGYEIGSVFYAPCDELDEEIVPIMKESLLYAAKAVSAPYLIPLGPDILQIQVNVNAEDPTETLLTVVASEDALIVPWANFDQEKSQQVAAIQVYVDSHPYDSTSLPLAMEATDGAFDQEEEEASLTFNSAELTGRHVFYFQATDSLGYDGPVSAVYVDYPEETIVVDIIAISNYSGTNNTNSTNTTNYTNITTVYNNTTNSTFNATTPSSMDESVTFEGDVTSSTTSFTVSIRQAPPIRSFNHMNKKSDSMDE